MPGDMVLTHLGRFRPVLRTAKRVVQGTIALHAKTLDTLRLTEDHPIWGCWIDKYRETDGPWWMLAGKVVSRVYKEVIRDGAVRSEANQDAHTAATLIFPVRENPIAEIDFREWVTLLPTKDNEIFESEDFLTSSHVATGWINWRQLLDYAFGRVVGLYLAEGCCSRAAVTWAFNARTEQHLVDEITAFLSDRIGVRTRVREASNCFSVTCSLALLYDFFAGFGRGARVKYLPSWIWDAPDEFLRGVLSGWAEGDGYEWGGKIRGTTSSRSLVWHMRLMMLRLGIESNIVVRPSPGLVTIKGRLTQTHEAYEISWQIDGNKLTAAIPIEGGRAYSIMRRENLSEEIEVFNIEVMEDKSYVTTGGTVHNCGFPGRAHDDLVDSTTTALSFARRHGVVVRKVEHEAAEYQRKLYRRTPKMPYAIT
jgi:intein/homing endonuclease